MWVSGFNSGFKFSGFASWFTFCRRHDDDGGGGGGGCYPYVYIPYS